MAVGAGRVRGLDISGRGGSRQAGRLAGRQCYKGPIPARARGRLLHGHVFEHGRFGIHGNVRCDEEKGSGGTFAGVWVPALVQCDRLIKFCEVDAQCGRPGMCRCTDTDTGTNKGAERCVGTEFVKGSLYGRSGIVRIDVCACNHFQSDHANQQLGTKRKFLFPNTSLPVALKRIT